MGRKKEPRTEFRDLRTGLDLSQEAVGTLVHATKRTVQRWEAGNSRVDPLALEKLRELTLSRKRGA